MSCTTVIDLITAVPAEVAATSFLSSFTRAWFNLSENIDVFLAFPNVSVVASLPPAKQRFCKKESCYCRSGRPRV